MNLLLDPLAPDLTPVLETALDAVVIMRADGVVAEWNRVAEQIFGWSRDQAVGKQLSALIIPERFRDAHHRGLAHYLATGEGPVLNRHFEISALNADGEEFPVELSITPTRNGGETLFLGFMRDIRERKTAEETIRRRAAESEAIAGLTALAAEGSSFELVMEACLRAVCEITGWTLGHAWCCPSDDPAALVETGIWYCPHERDFGALVEATAAIAFRSGVGLPGKSLERLEPVWMADVENQQNFPRAEAAAAAGLHSAFAFPIQNGSQPIAVLEFFHEAPTQPDPSLWPTLRTLGEQVGRVFERVHAAEMLSHEHTSLLAEIERRKTLEERQQLLLNELNHRVKNILAVVGGIAHQTAKNSAGVPQFLDAFSGRLTALATAHALLTREQWESAPLADLIGELVAPFSAGDGRIAIDGPVVTLQPRQLVALSLIVHELLTNALKHGALSTANGTIKLTWTLKSAGRRPVVSLRWREQGLSGIVAPAHLGFGSRLLETSVRHEADGKIDTRWNDDGLELHIDLPLEQA